MSRLRLPIGEVSSRAGTPEWDGTEQSRGVGPGGTPAGSAWPVVCSRTDEAQGDCTIHMICLAKGTHAAGAGSSKSGQSLAHSYDLKRFGRKIRGKTRRTFADRTPARATGYWLSRYSRIRPRLMIGFWISEV